jgi:hypothetical protein
MRIRQNSLRISGGISLNQLLICLSARLVTESNATVMGVRRKSILKPFHNEYRLQGNMERRQATIMVSLTMKDEFPNLAGREPELFFVFPHFFVTPRIT